MLDTVASAETPEGILLELRPAGLTVRACAFCLDLLIRLILVTVLFVITAALGGFVNGLALICLFALEWLYPVAFELTRWGATPGKRAFGLRVVMDDGLPITTAASLTRNLLRVADFLPLLYGFGIVSLLIRRDFKRLGDLAAATLVVYQPRTAAKPAPDPTTDKGAPLAPVRPTSSRDQAAVIALASRARQLTPSRLDELAALAAPVTGDTGRSGPEVTRRVLAAARWFLGSR